MTFMHNLIFSLVHNIYILNFNDIATTEATSGQPLTLI